MIVLVRMPNAMGMEGCLYIFVSGTDDGKCGVMHREVGQVHCPSPVAVAFGVTVVGIEGGHEEMPVEQ